MALLSAPGSTNGTYQTHTIVSDQFCSKIPASLSHEAACTVSVAFGTALAGIEALLISQGGTKTIQVLRLESQNESALTVLVWGAGSSVGAMAVQLLKLSGHKVIATASEKNFDYVKSLGVDLVVDYRDGEKAVREIREFTGGNLTLVYDSISLPSSIPLATRCIGSTSRKIVVDIPGMETFDIGGGEDVEIVSAGVDRLFTIPELQNTFDIVGELLKKDVLVSHRIQIIPGGLLGVNEGWRRARAGEISAQKLVYQVADTPGSQM